MTDIDRSIPLRWGTESSSVYYVTPFPESATVNQMADLRSATLLWTAKKFLPNSVRATWGVYKGFDRDAGIEIALNVRPQELSLYIENKSIAEVPHSDNISANWWLLFLRWEVDFFSSGRRSLFCTECIIESIFSVLRRFVTEIRRKKLKTEIRNWKRLELHLLFYSQNTVGGKQCQSISTIHRRYADFNRKK